MTTQSMDPYAAPQSEVHDASAEAFGEAKVLSFSGRIGRLRYLAYSMGLMFVWFIVMILVGIAAPALESGSEQTMAMAVGVFAIVFYLIMMVASFVLAVRRINDFDSSGWLSLLLLIPVLNIILALMLWFKPGTVGENKYGLQPPPNSGGVVVLSIIGPLFLVGYIGVMAAVAIPAYQQYVMKAQQAQMQQQ